MRLLSLPVCELMYRIRKGQFDMRRSLDKRTDIHTIFAIIINLHLLHFYHGQLKYAERSQMNS
jgi:hypothetical protein